MPLSDDKTLDMLFEDLRAKLVLAAQADDALNAAVVNVATARQASQDAQREARIALQAFLQHVSTSSVLTPTEQAQFQQIFGQRLLPNLDPDALGKIVKEATIEVALEAEKVQP
jgi:hypothetical protein